jgi:hypothetical protein
MRDSVMRNHTFVTSFQLWLQKKGKKIFQNKISKMQNYMSHVHRFFNIFKFWHNLLPDAI